MLHVIAIIELKPDSRDSFLKEFHAIVPTVQGEPGCIEYGPAIDATTEIPAQAALGPDTVCVVEKWESVAALESHLAAPHMADYRERVRDLVHNVRLHILQPA